MHLKKSKAVSLAVLLATLTLVGAGCSGPKVGTKPVAWNLSFMKNTPASIVMDVVGVSPMDKAHLSSINVKTYWKSPLRKELIKVTAQLPTGEPWILKIDEPIWKQWKSYGANELMVIAMLPCTDCEDRARIFVPLDKAAWAKYKNRTLEFEVQDQWIHVLTPQNP